MNVFSCRSSGNNLLVVLCRQINSVLVSSGGQVALQSLDLLRVLLRTHKQTGCERVRSPPSQLSRRLLTLMSVRLVSFWLTSGLFMMFLALLAYSSVLRVSCADTNKPTAVNQMSCSTSEAPGRHRCTETTGRTSRLEEAGDTVAMMEVLVRPPSESCRILVSLDSLWRIKASQFYFEICFLCSHRFSESHVRLIWVQVAPPLTCRGRGASSPPEQ